MALTHCILGKFLGVGCHCFPPPLDVPAFSARCLHVQRRERPLAAEGGTLRGREMFRQISSRIRLPRNSRDLLHAANLRHRTDGFTSPPKEGALKTKCFIYLTKSSCAFYSDGWTLCWMCWLYPVVNDSVGEARFTSVCRTLLQYSDKIQKLIWKFFSAFLVDLPRFHAAVTSRGVCCFYLTSSFKYELSSFLKWRGKDRTGKILTINLATESGASWHTEPRSLTLRVPTCLFATFLCFRLHHAQTQQKSKILIRNRIEITNKTRPCNRIYYSNVS